MGLHDRDDQGVTHEQFVLLADQSRGLDKKWSDRGDLDSQERNSPLCLWGLCLWGQTDLEFSPLRPRARSSAMRSCLAFPSLPLWGLPLWGQTDLEFSPLRPRARSSAMRSCLAFDSLWSSAANRADRLGTLSGRERPRIGTSSARVASVWCFAR